MEDVGITKGNLGLRRTSQVYLISFLIEILNWKIKKYVKQMGHLGPLSDPSEQEEKNICVKFCSIG